MSETTKYRFWAEPGVAGVIFVPNWIEQVSRFNPVNWGVQSARNAVVVGGNWGSTGIYLVLLIAATAAISHGAQSA